MKKILCIVCLLFLGVRSIVKPSEIKHQPDNSTAKAVIAADSLLASMEDLQRASEKLGSLKDH